VSGGTGRSNVTLYMNDYSNDGFKSILFSLTAVIVDPTGSDEPSHHTPNVSVVASLPTL
jgi:hypothetical protein